MARRSSSMLPQILTVGAILGVGLLVGKYALASNATPPNPNPLPPLPPLPNPNPNPNPLPPVPRPPTDINALMALYAQLLSQAATNPQSVDPAQMEQLAMQLDSAGYGVQANQLRSAAQQVRVLRGLPPASTSFMTAAEPPAVSPFAQV